jgi:hypothetical protein
MDCRAGGRLTGTKLCGVIESKGMIEIAGDK